MVPRRDHTDKQRPYGTKPAWQRAPVIIPRNHYPLREVAYSKGHYELKGPARWQIYGSETTLPRSSLINPASTNPFLYDIIRRRTHKVEWGLGAQKDRPPGSIGQQKHN